MVEWMRHACLGVVLMLVAGAAGCAMPPHRYHAQYAMHRSTIQRVLVLPPEISLIESGQDGRPLLRDNQSRAVSVGIQQILVDDLSKGAVEVRSASQRLLQSSETHQLRTLYRNVNRAIQLHAYGPQLFPSKLDNFDYALGSVSGLLDAAGADAALLVLGRHFIEQQKTRTWISAAVVEPGGAIIWYGVEGNIASTPGNADTVVSRLTRRVIQPFLKNAL